MSNNISHNHKDRRHSKLLIIIPAIIIVCLAAYVIINVLFSPYWGSVYAPTGYLSFASIDYAESDELTYTKEEATEDLEYIQSCLERDHPLFEDGVPTKFSEQMQKEIDSWGDTVTTYELWRSAARLLSVLGDAHTMVSTSFSRNYLCDYIDKIDNGYTLTAVNGTNIEDIFCENNDLFSYELDSWGVECVLNCMETLEGLKLLDIDTESKITYTYTDNDGNIIDVVYTSEDFYSYDESAEILGSSDEDDIAYEYTVDSNNNVGIFYMYTCEYDNDFKEELYNFFTEVIDGGIENVVVDLRDNSGGNSSVADEFLAYLDHDTYKTSAGLWRLGLYTLLWDAIEQSITHYDDMLFDGNVYVLTSTGTFSSACSFAEMIGDNDFGTIVGETCGNMPASYGEVVVFQTPNSLLSFQVSSKYFGRIDESKEDEPLTPDVECDAQNALDVVLDIISDDNS